MKKVRFFFVACLAFMYAACLFADIPASGALGYFYNPESGKFLSHGVTSVSNSGAKVDDYGVPVTITNEGKISEFSDADYNYLRIQMTDYVGRYLRIVANGLDCGGTSYHKWAVRETETGKFVFRCIYQTSQVAGATQGYYVAVDENDGLILVDGLENAARWEFVDATTQISLVKEAADKRLLAIAQQGGINTSDPAELETALAGMEATDMTSSITNPTMYENTDGWTVNNIQGTAISNGSYQIQNAASTQCNCSQTISGLPAGFYKVQVQTFYRASSLAQCVSIGNKGYVFSNAFVKANNNQIQIKDWFAIRIDDSSPNSRSAIKDEFNEGEKYTHSIYTYVAEDGNLTISINVPSYSAGDYPNWICFNNVRLTYYASKEDLSPYETALASVVAKAEAIEGLPTQSKADLLNFVSQHNKSYTSVEEYNNVIAAINEEIVLANNVVAAYSSYQQTKALMQSVCDQKVYTDEGNAYETYSAAVEALDKNINEASIDDCVSVINSSVNDIRGVMTTFISSVTINEGASFDITNLLVNPQLLPKTSSSAEGWTYTQNLDFGSYQITQFPNASSFNIYQTLKDMPEGSYTMTVRAFHRPGAFSSSDMTTVANTDIPTYVYINDTKVTICNICQGAATNIGGASTKVDGETIYIPNSRSHLAPFLSADYYINTVNAKVEEGDLTLGLAFDSWVSGGWGIVTDFHLYYRGVVEEVFELSTYPEIASQAIDHSDYDTTIADVQSRLESATTDEEKQALQDEVLQALAKLLKEQTTETGQFDISSLIVNADFADGANGWNVENAKLKTGNDVGYVADTDKDVSVSQVLKYMPAGHYQFKTQAFYRPADIDKAAYDLENGVQQIAASLYLAGESIPLQGIFDGRRFDAGTYCIFDGRSVPTSLSSAAAFFKSGEYWNVLEADLSEDGEISLGVKVTAEAASGNQTVFDNFRLYYGAEPVFSLALGEATTVNEPVIANISLKKTFAAGALVPLCVPFEVNTDMFAEVYQVGGIESSQAVLYPVNKVKPGVPCVVKSNVDLSELTLSNVNVSPVSPDVYILPWDGGYLVPLTTTFNWKYFDSTETEKSALSLKYVIVNKRNTVFNVNLESLRARMFVNNTTYTSSSASVVSNYNKAPTVRRDIPAAAAIPVPENNAKELKIVYRDFYVKSSGKEQRILPGSDMAYITNLLPQKIYSYQIVADGATIAEGRFNTTGRLRMVYVPSAYNIRDLGGWLNEDGKRVNYGHIYRGSTLNGYVNCTKEDLKRLQDVMNVGAEIDLRYMESYDKDLGCGTSPFGFTKAAGNYYFAAANDYLAEDITNAATQKRWKEEFEFICNNFRQGKAVYFHCAWGADRTGLFALLLEGLLGVNLDQIYKDYELTSFSAAPGATNRLKTNFEDRVSVFTKMTGTKLAEKVENFFINSIGVSKEDIDYFREVMLDEDYVAEGITVDEMESFLNDKNVTTKATLIRTLEAGKRNIIVLPFTVSRLDMAKLTGGKTKFESITGFDAEGHLKTGVLAKNVPNVPFLITPEVGAEDNTYIFENATFVNGAPYISAFTKGKVVSSYEQTTYVNSESYTRAAYMMKDGRLEQVVTTPLDDVDESYGVIHGTNGYVIIDIPDGEYPPATIYFNDDEFITSVNNIKNVTTRFSNGVYTISGQRVNAPSKGLYIINGKKVLVK